MLISGLAGVRAVAGTLFALVALLTAGCAAPHSFSGTVLEPPLEVPAFTLVDASGQPFDLAGQPGQVTLVFFGYTNCPDVCPLTMARVKQATEKLSAGDARRVRVIFVTVDPVRDTPEVAGRFVRSFDPSWIALTGDPETLARARAAYGVYGEPAAGDHDAHASYEVAHTDRIFALTGRNAVRVIFHSDTPPETLAADIRALLRS